MAGLDGALAAAGLLRPRLRAERRQIAAGRRPAEAFVLAWEEPQGMRLACQPYSIIPIRPGALIPSPASAKLSRFGETRHAP